MEPKELLGMLKDGFFCIGFKEVGKNDEW